jgi:hypothetical protein
MGKGTAVCTFAAAVTMALTSGVSPSSAAPRPAEPAAAVRGDMHVVGFDAAVARAHGYQIKTAANGRQYPARAGAASSAVSPDNQVGGNCGISYVYEYGIGNRAIELYTGYSVTGSVYQWYWTVRLDDRGGSSYQRFQGGANAGTWQTDRVVGGLTRGGARATVINGSSVAFLNDGRICSSGGPYDSTTIT